MIAPDTYTSVNPFSSVALGSCPKQGLLLQRQGCLYPRLSWDEERDF